MNLENLKSVRRGYTPSDEKDFTGKSLSKVKEASLDVSYLLNREYKIKNAVTFVGNHYLLSERQRLFLCRTLCSSKALKIRKEKELSINSLEGKNVYIDGFNTIITLETALSKSFIYKCSDNTIRDLAGIRGSYKIIDKTLKSLNLILDTLEELKIKKGEFFLDAPVSNSGRLKELIIALSEKYNFIVDVHVINNVDSILSYIWNGCSTYSLFPWEIHKSIGSVFVRGNIKLCT